MAPGVMLEQLLGEGLLGASYTRGLTFVNVVCMLEQQAPPPQPPICSLQAPITPSMEVVEFYILRKKPLALSITERWNAKPPRGMWGLVSLSHNSIRQCFTYFETILLGEYRLELCLPWKLTHKSQHTDVPC